MGIYHDGSRELQDRHDTRRLADRLDERLVTPGVIGADARAFIERMDMFFLATADADGHPQCSYKGGDPGFVRVLDEHTIAFPDYDGNGMFLSLGNVAVNPHVGLLFIDFAAERPSRTRLNGTARLSEDPELLASWPGARSAVVVTATQVFPNCPRYIHRMTPAERSPYVPDSGGAAPEPSWKSADWAVDVLPAGGTARDHA